MMDAGSGAPWTDRVAEAGPVAFGAREPPKSGRDLWRDVATVAEALPHPDEPTRILLVFERDRYAFAVALIAAWARGHVPVLPPDNRRATLAELNRSCGGVLHDTHSGLKYRVLALLTDPRGQPDLMRRAFDSRWQRGVTIELHSAIGASMVSSRDLQAEVDALRSAAPWPNGVRVAASVGIGHRFSLVWSVLRPLLHGGSFSRTMRVPVARWPDELNENRIDTLITCPSDLRLAARSRALRTLAQPAGSGPAVSAAPLSASEGRPYTTLDRVVSAGARLMPSVAVGASAALGVRVTDAFVLTPVGTLALRPAPQDAGPVAAATEWSTVDGRAVRRDPAGYLVVGDGESAITTRDRVVIADDAPNRFSYLGRAEERVDLAHGSMSTMEVEEAVLALDGIEDAAALVFGAPDGPVVLVCAQTELLESSVVKAHLARCFDGLDSSRLMVKTVARLARDGLGRLSSKQARLLFGLGDDGSPRAYTLVWGSATVEPDHAEFAVTVPDNYRWFDGHFDGYPVLPAAIQLREIVLVAVTRTGWDVGPFGGAQRLKFTGRIGPGDGLTVRLKAIAPDAISFDISAKDRPCSSGRLRFRSLS